MEFLTFLLLQFSSVQWLSHAPLFATPWTATHQASLSMNNSRSLPTLMSIESVMLYNHLNLCCFHRFLPSIFPNIRVFSNESGHHIRWPNIGVSSSTSVLPMNIQEWFLSGWTDWISLQSKGLSRVFTNITVQKHRFFNTQLFIVQLSHPYMAIEKTIALTRWTFVDKIMSLLFNMLSSMVITFLPRNKCLNFMAAINICSDFGAWKNKVSHCFPCFAIYLPWSNGTGCHNLSFLMLSFKPTFSLPSFTFIKRLFSYSSLCDIRVVSSVYLRLLIFLPAILISSCASSSSVAHDIFCM